MSETRLGSRVIARLIGEDYDQHVRRLAPTDFWGQVRRQVDGRPITENQVALIIGAIERALQPRPGDMLLDLACGNGALSSRIAPGCAALHGVDISAALIDVAQTSFADPPRLTFSRAEIADYVETDPEPGRFTKAFCYGGFASLTRHNARRVLQQLGRRFPSVSTVFLGSLPDRERASLASSGALTNPLTERGIWRTADEIAALAGQTGWHAAISHMPSHFYAAHDSFDATLTRLPA